MEIYLLQNGQQAGPYTREEIIKYVADNLLTDQDFAWSPGDAEWRPIKAFLAQTPAAVALKSPISDQALWSGHPSYWHYFWAWLWAIFLIPVGVGLLMIPFIIYARNRRLYTVTDKKVIIQRGIFVRSTRQVRIADVRSIQVSKHFLSGLFGIGTVVFSSAARDDADVIFASIKKADSIHQLVSGMQS